MADVSQLVENQCASNKKQQFIGHKHGSKANSVSLSLDVTTISFNTNLQSARKVSNRTQSDFGGDFLRLFSDPLLQFFDCVRMDGVHAAFQVAPQPVVTPYLARTSFALRCCCHNILARRQSRNAAEG
jgi:hypothetical protein